MEDKRLFLLDAYALIYRAYYALIRSPRITSKGVNVSAVFGFTNTLNEILRKENPTHIAVCFDPPHGHTFRHDMYEAYKAGRDKQPEDITTAIPLIKELLDAYNIPVVEKDGFEADDVIGTLSRMAQADGFETFMMTPDKDYGQLVTDRVFMYRPALRGEGFEIRGPQQVCEKYNIDNPLQVIDMLALEGDASDNIPGCPGVGEKTASKLIKEFGSVENLIENTGKLKGALRSKIEDNSEQILFSKTLATIKTDVPLDGLTIGSLERRPENIEALRDFFKRLEFRNFLNQLEKRVPNTPAATHVEKRTSRPTDQLSLFDTPAEDQSEPAVAASCSIEYCNTVADAANAVSSAAVRPAVGIAVAASGTSDMQKRIAEISISWCEGTATIIKPPLADETVRQELLDVLQPLFISESTTIVGHDIKQLMLVLANEGMSFTAPFFDTSVADYILEPERKHMPEQLASRYLNIEIPPFEPRKASVQEIDARLGLLAETAFRLFAPISSKISSEGLSSLLNDIELPLIPVLASMERSGVRIDVAELSKLSQQYSSRLEEMEKSVYAIAGKKFNISSPVQVGEVLFGEMQIDAKAKRTKKGAYSTTEEILSKYRAQYPVVDLILRIRALKKLLATYIDALPKLIDPADGKIHTSFNQTVTATGRISSTDPNLQNIPIRTDDGREIRRAFIPDPGDIMMSADYSQIELRLMADFSGDKHMVEAFLSGEDIHRATAAKIYHINTGEVTDTQRRNAKTANFGIIYGISAFGLSERLGIPRSEAKMLIDGYLNTYPGVRGYMDSNIESARTNGYVTTIMGRRRQLPDINSRNAVMRGFSERNAVNAPLQGSAADIIKKAMIDIDREIRNNGLKSRMIIQVHDELVFNIVPAELEQMQEIVARCMQSAYNGQVPLEISAGVGANWLEAH